MLVLVQLFYRLCLTLIRLYKWIEFQCLKALTPYLRRRGKALFRSIGVIFHCPGDDRWTEGDEKQALQRVAKKYDKLVHIRINDDIFFPRVTNAGSLALGEMYVEKIWEFTESEKDITELVRRFGGSEVRRERGLLDLYRHKWNLFLQWVELYAFNLQTEQRAFQVGKEHYDLGNDLYELMLDPWLQYSCGYWAKAATLEEAQLHKLDLIARKLDLKPGMRVLDIGCGWGMLCKYLAEKYEVECVGVTISKEGVAYGKKVCEGLPVEIRLQDYRQLNEQFDRVVSVGMFEHVGFRNYPEFFDVVHRCLKPEGIFLLHTIATNHSNMPRSDPWLHTYIFPNGNLPRPSDIADCTFGKFIIEDWHNFGPDYAKTLHCWLENFKLSWPKLQKIYGPRFYRIWTYYLAQCEALFLSRRLHLWQIVLSKNGLKTEYRAAR